MFRSNASAARWAAAAALIVLLAGILSLARRTAPLPASEGQPAATAQVPTPAGASTQAPAPDGERSHVVDDGETCAGIAFQYGITQDELVRANGMADNCSDLWVGQVLRVPPADDRLDIAEAGALVRQYIFDHNPQMNPEAAFPLEEITPPGAWQRMRAQVFKVTGGVQQYQSYTIVAGAVVPIGESFGGMGVNSMAVSDLDADGSAELLYAYGFGSGIHQSSVGMLRVVSGEPVTVALSGLHFPGNLTLEQIDDQTVLVEGSPDQNGGVEALGALQIAGEQLALVPTGETLEPSPASRLVLILR